MQGTTRQSPIQHLLSPLNPQWHTIGAGQVALRFTEIESERRVMRQLGLCDLSGLAKFGVKGHDAAAWLGSQDITVPDAIFAASCLSGGGFVARFGDNEFFIEDGIKAATVDSLRRDVAAATGDVFFVERQEATLLLTGERSLDVLSQTCAMNFCAAASGCVIMTRVAGVTCSILPEEVEGVPCYRLWVDASYAEYLWTALLEIAQSLGGDVIDVGCIYPESLP